MYCAVLMEIHARVCLLWLILGLKLILLFGSGWLFCWLMLLLRLELFYCWFLLVGLAWYMRLLFFSVGGLYWYFVTLFGVLIWCVVFGLAITLFACWVVWLILAVRCLFGLISSCLVWFTTVCVFCWFACVAGCFLLLWVYILFTLCLLLLFGFGGCVLFVAFVFFSGFDLRFNDESFFVVLLFKVLLVFCLLFCFLVTSLFACRLHTWVVWLLRLLFRLLAVCFCLFVGFVFFIDGFVAYVFIV